MTYNAFLSLYTIIILPIKEANLLKKQPNLLFIFADQWRRQSTGFSNQDSIFTPNIDRLAQSGTVLTQAISSCPLCSPYRGSLFTGKYPLSNGVYTNCKTGLDITLKDEEICLSDLLKTYGYQTGYIGKWHLDVPEQNHTPHPLSGAHDWDAYTPPGPKRHNFDFWYSYGADDHHLTPHYWADSPEQIKVNEWSITHETSVAIDYINTHHHSPFALFLSYNPPHSPYDLVPEKYLNLYKDKPLSPRKNVIYDTIGYHTHEPQTYNQAELEIMTKQYFAAITGLDEHIGLLVDCLKANNVYEDTLIIITADHGDMMGSHGLMAKHVWYEESIGIPFILHWKNGTLTAGTSDIVLDTTDIMPTLLDLLSIPKPNTLQGQSVATYLTSNDLHGPSDKVGYICAFPGRTVFQEQFDAAHLDPKDWGWRGIRTRDYSFVIHVGYLPECTTPTRYLYNLKADPYQLNPIAENTVEYQTIVPLLEAQLKTWLISQNDCFIKWLD